jgi:acyl-CoA thioesterase FadM
MSRTTTLTVDVHFADCDPAGIVGTPLLEVNIKFIQAVTYGETITISNWIEDRCKKVFVRRQRVTRGDDLMCEGRAVRAFATRDPDNADRLRAMPAPRGHQGALFLNSSRPQTTSFRRQP